MEYVRKLECELAALKRQKAGNEGRQLPQSVDDAGPFVENSTQVPALGRKREAMSRSKVRYSGLQFPIRSVHILSKEGSSAFIPWNLVWFVMVIRYVRENDLLFTNFLKSTLGLKSCSG
jgi:hypothetical protein